MIWDLRFRSYFFPSAHETRPHSFSFHVVKSLRRFIETREFNTCCHRRHHHHRFFLFSYRKWKRRICQIEKFTIILNLSSSVLARDFLQQVKISLAAAFGLMVAVNFSFCFSQTWLENPSHLWDSLTVSENIVYCEFFTLRWCAAAVRVSLPLEHELNWNVRNKSWYTHEIRQHKLNFPSLSLFLAIHLWWSVLAVLLRLRILFHLTSFPPHSTFRINVVCSCSEDGKISNLFWQKFSCRSIEVRAEAIINDDGRGMSDIERQELKPIKQKKNNR